MPPDDTFVLAGILKEKITSNDLTNKNCAHILSFSGYFTIFNFSSLSCAVMPPDDTFVLAGTYLGDVKMFNMKTGAEESSYNCHDSQVTNLQVRP